MKNIILLFVLFVMQFCIPAFASEPVVLKVTPAQLISTKKDNMVEVGDILEFKTVRDAEKNDKLFIKEGTPVYGFVGNVHENGFAGDMAEIVIEKFKTTDVNGKIVYISNSMTITGNMSFSNFIKQNLTAKIASCFFVIRGAEIYLKPGEHVFNIIYFP